MQDDGIIVLPEELITKILSSLPVGPCIGRIRCVCKSWRDLLSDPSFIQKMLSSSPPDRLMIASRSKAFTLQYSPGDNNTRPPIRSPVVDLPVNPARGGPGPGPAPKVVGCCKGLLCVRHGGDLILWNPAISETKLLPLSPFYLPNTMHVHADGFGFDPETNDYKVVRQVVHGNNFREHCIALVGRRCFQEVYSLRNDSWKKQDHVVCCGGDDDGDYDGSDGGPWLPPRRVPQLHKGKLYWGQSSDVRFASRSPERDTQITTIVFDSFDMSKEVFRIEEVPYPPLTKCSADVGEYDEYLLNEETMVAVFELLDDDEDDYLVEKGWWEIWVLLKYWVSESWTKLFVITVPSVIDITLTGISRDLKCFFLLHDEVGQSLNVFHHETDKFSPLQFYGEWRAVVTSYIPSLEFLRARTLLA